MKRLFVLVVVVVALIGLSIVGAPFIAATDIAKRRIAAQIEEWTGRPVSFRGEPRVRLFPFLTLTIEDARIGNPPEMGGEPLVVMEGLTSKLRLLPFLIGQVDVAEFQLVRPHFNLTVDADGRANWPISQWSISEEPGVPSKANSAPSAESELARIGDIKLGRFRVIDGTVSYDNLRSGRHEELTGLELKLEWPRVAEPVAGTGAFTWRGELVEFNGSIGEPLKLIAGETSAARFGIASKPFRVSFTGTANSIASTQLEGAASVTAPSVRRVAAWLGVPMGDGAILGAGLLDGDVNWIGSTLSFSDTHVELDGNRADGALSLDLSDQKPKVLGTLALQTLDLSAYLETFQAAVSSEGPWPLAPIRMPLLDVADADIRLSAGEILAGAARVGKSAVSAALLDGRLVVDIGEAQFYGGSLEANAVIAMSGGALVGSANVTIDGTPAGPALGDFFGISFLDGPVSASIEVSGGGDTWGDLIGAVTGAADVRIVDGTLRGFELGNIAALAGAPRIVDPAEGTGTIPFKSLTGSLTFADGAIDGTDIHVSGESFTIDLSGRVSLVNATLRGRGVLAAARVNSDRSEPRDIPFVVGGAWTDPYVLPDYERLIQRNTADPRAGGPAGSDAEPLRPNG
jgi:AsmA protein